MTPPPPPWPAHFGQHNVGSARSEWMTVHKGAPQGSILDPFILNFRTILLLN